MSDDLRDRLQRLSPAQRRLLERRILERDRAQRERDAIAPVAGDGPFPLSFAQERFWFLERLEPGNPAHHLPGIAVLRGPLDPGALRAALALLVERHAILRTVYLDLLDGPAQRVLPAAPLALDAVDLRGRAPSERAAERAALEEATLLAPFDLARGPVLRARLVRLEDELHHLLLCLHHVAADGASMRILGDELALAYGALADGREPELPPVEVRYADVCAWQRRHLSGERLERGVAWWRAALAGLEPLDLAPDRPRRGAARARGRRDGIDLAPALVSALRALARREGATPFHALCAAWQAVCARWSGATDVAVGLPVQNRGRAELERLVGLLANTVVVRADLGGSPSFRACLRAAAAATLGALDHQDVPFERVVDALAPERALDRNPLFQAFFNYVEAEGWTRPLGARVSMEYRLVPAGTAFDLSLYATVRDGRVRLELEHDPELFDAATIRRRLGHLEAFLHAVARDPDARVGTVPILGPEERLRLARLGAGPPAPPRAREELLVHERFAARARRHPDRVAVQDDGRALTYGEVDLLARRLARRLTEEGVRPGARVGVGLERGAALVPALLGIARAGAAWVPLCPRLPEARRAAMRAGAGVERVVVAADLEDAGDAPDVDLGIDPEAEAYVIHTSGSTGTPKGVRVPHRALVRFLDAIAETPGLGEQDRMLAVTTIGFDIALCELLAPLLAGGCVRIASAEDAADGVRLARRIAETRPTVMQATPATWRMLRLAGWSGLPGLRILSGGDALPRDLALELRSCGDEVWNLYGPTETTVWSTAERITSELVTIGRPLAGERVRVVEAGGDDAPIGVAGELVIAGEGVALGYAGPAAEEAFHVDPATGARAYRTGDVARRRADGRLELLGRRDGQVKVRGFRVELGEVEEALRSHPLVRDAACALRGDRLEAWVVADDPDPRALRAHVALRLPDYMVPASVAVVGALPLSPAGKLDRRALPRPAPAPPASPAPPAIEGAVARALQEIFAEVLEVASVGPDDDFFDLGGHSLAAARLAARVRASLGCEIPLRRFFEAPTIAALAPLVERARAAPAPELGPVPRAGLAPATFQQERLWVLEELTEGRSAYAMPGAVRLRGLLDADALERALRAVARRHEGLRSVLARPERPGEPPRQVPLDPEALALARVDLAGEGDPESAWRALAERLVAEPFDLAPEPGRAAPLVRATLARLAPEEHVLVLVLHHVVADAWSLGVLVREVSALYAAFRAGEPSPLPELPLQVADLALHQRDPSGPWSPAALEREAAWWRATLAGAPPAIDLPCDRPRPAVLSPAGARLARSLGAERASRLRALARARGASTFHALSAALFALLARLAGQDDVVIGTSVAGRARRETEPLIAFLANALPLRLALGRDASFADAVERARDVGLAALEHAELPFERLVEVLRPPRDLGRHPVFQATLDLQNAPAPPLALEGLEVEAIELFSGRSKFDVSFLFSDDPELSCAVEYATDLFDERTVARWWRSLEVLLDAALAAPKTRWSALPLLEAALEREVLALAPGPPLGAPPALLHDLALRVAASRPDAVAVRGEGFETTFRALAGRAHLLARRLQAAGVGPDVPVGVCLGRTRELVPALLAPLAAGGAYVPLDPTYPPARLARILADARPAAVLCDAATAPLLPPEVRALRVDLEPGEADEAPPCAATPEHLAYVLYTSGSTGEPKGVEVPHSAAAHYVASALALYAPESGDGAPLASSIGFDLTVTSLFPVLAAGRAVTLAPDGPGAAALAAALRARPGASLVKLTPAHLRALAAELAPSELAAAARALVVGGEALLLEDLAPWRARAVGTAIWNEYGPTETTVGCVAHRIGPGDPPSGPAPIGRPMPDVRAYVVEPSDDPGALGPLAPLGAPGELLIGGPGVARGYRGDPALTARRFLPDPWSPVPGARLYRTGDRARLAPSGELRFLGRLDGQLKVRGVRVEPAEVEAALRRHGARAAAAGLRDGRLVAWVVASKDVARGLRERVARELPDALVPSAVVAVEELPLTAHGKVDLPRLPAPERGDALRAAPAAPRGAAEEVLAAVVAGVLGLDAVGRDDDFFALGGDSILALSVVARAAERGLALSARDVFRRPTVAGLAGAAEAALEPEDDDSPREGAGPLLPAQRWLLGRGLARPERWNQALVLEARAGLAPETLEAALAAVARHHEALRAVFERDRSGVRLRVRPRVDVALARERGEPEGAALERAHEGFDLERGPLWRVTWFERGRAPALVVWSCHHALCDAVSWRVLLEDVTRAADALAEGRAVALPRRTAALLDCAAEAASAGGPEPAADPRNVEGAARAFELELDERASALLSGRAARAIGGTPEDLLVAALAAELARDGETALDVEGHGREGFSRDVSRTVGWFTSLVTVRARDEGGPLALALLAKEALRAARGRPGFRPRARVLLNYLGRTDAGAPAGLALAPTGRDPGPVKAPENARAHALEVDARLEGGRLRLAWRFAPALDRERDVRALGRRVLARLAALVDACAALEAPVLSPSDVPLAGLGQKELDALAAEHGPLEDVVPLTPTQRGMTFHALLAPESAAYVEQLACVLEGELDVPRLEAAFRALWRDVALLRGRVSWRGRDEPLLVVPRGPEAPWSSSDWSALSPAEAAQRLERACAAERARGFDLERGPLVRVAHAVLPAGRHAVLWTYHHLVLDGWSMPLVLEELLASYAGEGGAQGRPDGSAAAWREYVGWLCSRDRRAARAFWRGRLGGFARATPVGPRAAKSGAYGERELALDREETARIVELARARGVTLSTVAQAAWALALARTSGERDVVFGATVSGRPPELKGVERRIGLFINTLAVRVAVEDGARAGDWLRALQARRAEESRYEWTPLPLAQACADLAPGHELFESLVVFENYPLDGALRAAPGGLRVVEARPFERTSYPATVVFVPGDELRVRLLFDEGRFLPAEAERLLGTVRAALAALAAEPDAWVGELSVLAPEERADLCYALAPGPAPAWPGEPPLVHRAALARAAAEPARVAVEHEGRRLLYGELAAGAERIAARLAARGIGRGDVVALDLERSLERIAALYGVLRAGAAFLPLDPEHPLERRALQIAGAGARAVIRRSSSPTPPPGVPVLDVDRDDDDPRAAPPPDAARPEDLAYVIHTSGSTGGPKAVAVEHRSIAHYAAVAADTYALVPEDRVLAAAALAFDASLEEVLPALARGATLVLRGEDDLRSPGALARAVERLGVTLLNLPTALWHEVALGLAPEDAARLARVRGVILGGDVLHAAPLARWRALGLGAPVLWNTYGPTEATIVSTVHVVGDEDGAPPIGRPIPGARVFVVDDALRLVPRGYAGELAIAGPGVARGYLGRAEEEARRFAGDVFPGSARGDRLYRTGDRARWNERGLLEFLGRADDQVKVRGQRVELGEVEHALRALPGVARAAAVAHEDAAGRTALAAFVVADPGARLEPQALSDALRARVPDALVPARLEVLDALPRTREGKVDRAALRARAAGPGPAGAQERDGLDAGVGAGPDAARVAALFAEALGRARVGPDDDFFALGGDSLVAVRLLGLAERRLGVEPPLRALFEAPTPRRLARALAGGAEADAVDLERDALLPADVAPERPGPALDPPLRVLVTGATGFLGAHLVLALRERLPAGARVTALVRAADDAAARARLCAALERFGLQADPASVDAVAGDLARPALGLEPRTRARLAEELDAIVHAGADVHFLKPYAALRDANVGGTLEALRLACAGRPKAFHHVSTVGVFDVADPPPVLLETADLAAFRGVRGGYARSKWVAERLVAAARGRGLAARVLRPGRLVASTRTGLASPGDAAFELFAACVALRAAPDVALALDATPVDHAARAIAALALDPRGAGGDFHVVHAALLRPEDAAAALAAAGFELALVPPRAWLDALRSAARSDARLAALLPLVEGAPELTGAPAPAGPRIDDARARALLEAAGVRPPALDAAYLVRVASAIAPGARRNLSVDPPGVAL